MVGATDAGSVSGRLAIEDVARLYAEQAARVRRLVGSATRASDAEIEDACQVAWSRLIRCRARVHADTATAWVARTAIREAIRARRCHERELPLDHLGDGPLGDTPDLLERLVEQRARMDALQALTRRQQRLVWLQGVGLSYAEMAAQTGDSRRTVERQLRHARTALARSEAA